MSDVILVFAESGDVKKEIYFQSGLMPVWKNFGMERLFINSDGISSEGLQLYTAHLNFEVYLKSQNFLVFDDQLGNPLDLSDVMIYEDEQATSASELLEKDPDEAKKAILKAIWKPISDLVSVTVNYPDAVLYAEYFD